MSHRIRTRIVGSYPLVRMILHFRSLTTTQRVFPVGLSHGNGALSIPTRWSQHGSHAHDSRGRRVPRSSGRFRHSGGASTPSNSRASSKRFVLRLLVADRRPGGSDQWASSQLPSFSSRAAEWPPYFVPRHAASPHGADIHSSWCPPRGLRRLRRPRGPCHFAATSRDSSWFRSLRRLR